MHHIHSEELQIKAVQEALRIVKNGGIIIIRESNLANPIFKLFWNYIFPLTSKIDKFGGESWVSAKHLQESFNDFLIETIYFTFIPNNIPKPLLPIADKAEKVLQKSKIKKMSAHYLLVLKKHE